MYIVEQPLSVSEFTKELKRYEHRKMYTVHQYGRLFAERNQNRFMFGTLADLIQTKSIREFIEYAEAFCVDWSKSTALCMSEYEMLVETLYVRGDDNEEIDD